MFYMDYGGFNTVYLFVLKNLPQNRYHIVTNIYIIIYTVLFLIHMFKLTLHFKHFNKTLCYKNSLNIDVTGSQEANKTVLYTSILII